MGGEKMSETELSVQAKIDKLRKQIDAIPSHASEYFPLALQREVAEDLERQITKLRETLP